MSYALDEGQRWYKGSRDYQYSCTHLYVSGVFVENKIKKVSMQNKEGEYIKKVSMQAKSDGECMAASPNISSFGRNGQRDSRGRMQGIGEKKYESSR